MDPIFVSTISKWQKRDQRKKYIELFLIFRNFLILTKKSICEKRKNIILDWNTLTATRIAMVS